MSDRIKVVIVGGVAGGASCAARCRRLSEDAEIIMIERGFNISFANCGLPYYLGGVIEDRDELLIQTPEKMHAWFKIDIRTNTEVTAINRTKKEVTTKNLSTGEEKTVSYNFLVLSPGAEPVKPPIPGADSDRIFTLRNLKDTDEIYKFINEKDPKHVLVIGGGYIGLEMVEALRENPADIKVTLVELLPQVMNVIDPEFASPLHIEIRKQGVDLVLNTAVEAFSDENNQLAVTLSNGDKIQCDFAIMAIGIRPETDLAKNAGLEIGKSGGIVVDNHTRTSDPNIFAVGDAVEYRGLICGRPMLMPLAGPANRQGRIAADNIFGKDSVYKQAQGTAICKVFDLAVGMTGLNEKHLKQVKIRYEKIYIHPFSHASYYPNASPNTIKMMFDPDTGKIFGAQAVGIKSIDKRIDVISMAIRYGTSIYDLEDVELSYAPPFGSAKDPINFLGYVASNIKNADMLICHVEEIMNNRDGILLLDVRNRDEVEQTDLIPGALNIPLPELRDKLHEIPTDREVITYCQVGIRGFIAHRILLQKGYKTRNLNGGYRTWRDCNGTSLPLLPKRPLKDS